MLYDVSYSFEESQRDERKNHTWTDTRPRGLSTNLFFYSILQLSPWYRYKFSKLLTLQIKRTVLVNSSLQSLLSLIIPPLHVPTVSRLGLRPLLLPRTGFANGLTAFFLDLLAAKAFTYPHPLITPLHQSNHNPIFNLDWAIQHIYFHRQITISFCTKHINMWRKLSETRGHLRARINSKYKIVYNPSINHVVRKKPRE